MKFTYAILSPVACPALKYFSTLSDKLHDFRKKTLLNIKFVLWSPVQFLCVVITCTLFVCCDHLYTFVCCDHLYTFCVLWSPVHFLCAVITCTIFVCCDHLYTFCVLWSPVHFLSETISHSKTKWSKMYIVLIKTEFSGRFFEQYANIKFHDNPLGGSGVVPCGQTWRS